jgi:predicted transglutaminase-like cysteine proteinase
VLQDRIAAVPPPTPAHRIAASMVRLVLAAWLASTATSALAQPTAPSRGQTLYELHCIGCHSTQMHWREQRRATDWASLAALVRQWQGAAFLDWSDDDIDAVARFLNQTIYRFPAPAQPVGGAAPAAARRQG